MAPAGPPANLCGSIISSENDISKLCSLEQLCQLLCRTTFALTSSYEYGCHQLRAGEGAGTDGGGASAPGRPAVCFLTMLDFKFFYYIWLHFALSR